MFVEAALLGWSALAVLWWGVSCGLVWADGRKPAVDLPPDNSRTDPLTLTLFKPLAPLGARDFDFRGIASFLAQMGRCDDLLVGAHEYDRARLEPTLRALAAEFPSAQMRVVWRAEPDTVANPKVAWLQFLAPHAQGALWLWSDADIIAPPGFLCSAREAYRAGNARLLTWPYVVREMTSAPALLDALFVNADFFPGVLLLRALGPVDFGLGAGLLFARADFEAAVSWSELGAALADDFELAQRLRPVRVGQTALTTKADVADWRDAMLHYLRWSKTVRWNRPGGTAARLVVLPVLGWLASVLAHPSSLFGWLGLFGMMQFDVLAVVLIFNGIRCRIGWRDVPALEFWSLGRAFIWLACWLPWPVVWRGRRWWGPLDQSAPERARFDKA